MNTWQKWKCSRSICNGKWTISPKCHSSICVEHLPCKIRHFDLHEQHLYLLLLSLLLWLCVYRTAYAYLISSGQEAIRYQLFGGVIGELQSANHHFGSMFLWFPLKSTANHAVFSLDLLFTWATFSVLIFGQHRDIHPRLNRCRCESYKHLQHDWHINRQTHLLSPLFFASFLLWSKTLLNNFHWYVPCRSTHTVQNILCKSC